MSEHDTTSGASSEPTRRDFLYLTTGMAGAVGAVAVAWPFVDQGRIIEEGTHEALIAKGGLYAELWARQSGGFLASDDGAGEGTGGREAKVV